MKTIAQLLVAVFRPDFYPLVGYTLLFTLSYLHILPWQFKMWVLSTVCLFTILLPFLLIWTAREIGRLSGNDKYLQQHHYIVYAINIICYVCCMYVFSDLYIPSFMSAILAVSLMVQCVCVVIGIWHKVSMPCAGTGLLIGSLLSYSYIFSFNPTWWLCASIILSGAVMSSHMYLSRSTMKEAMSGTLIGILCGAVGINMYIRLI